MASSAASSSSRCGAHAGGAFRPVRLRAVLGGRSSRSQRHGAPHGVFLGGARAVGLEWDPRQDRRGLGVVHAETAGDEGGQTWERRGQDDGRRGGGGQGRRSRRDSRQEEVLEERVVQVSRVSKTVKGGRNISFRAVAVVGNENGRVGVGNRSAKEISVAVNKAVKEARKNIIDVPLSPKTRTFPHRVDLSYGAAKVMLRPASEGTGVIAGGAMKVVLELAGVKNCFGKQLGSDNPMNNAKATIEALRSMKTFKEVAEDRGVSVPYLLGLSLDHQATWSSVRKEQEAREAALASGPSAEGSDAASAESAAASS